ncbi:MAG: rod shape-determining protein RodA [Bdellovibrionales bacterium]|nr:rod shape-determining protein RodA [Bdellovibrionales bacterium]
MGILGGQKAPDFATTEESRFDWTLLGTVVGIMCIGLVNVYSATSGRGSGMSASAMALRQLVHLGGGLGVIGILMLIDYRLIERMAYVFYALNLVALMAVEALGVLRLGARRWIDFGFFAYQPSETMKLCVILALARYFHNKNSMAKMGFREMIPPALIVGIPGLLTIIQPDLGTGGHMMIAGAVMLLFVGIRPSVLWTLAVVGIVSFPLAWQYGLKPYQKDRIRTFVDPMQDPKGDGYNAIQSMIAVGSGEVTGKGFQKGTQTQLDFTPEGHTDFIFTVLAEEWGLVGSLFLLGAYLFLLQRCVTIASLARDKFGSLVCVGIIAMLTSQIFINISMVCGMFPIVGIPLPLVSYGGTAVINVCLALGILLNVGYKRTIF